MKNTHLIIQINELLQEFFREKEKFAQKLGPQMQEITKQIVDLTLLGKDRLRPLLVYYGYLLCQLSKQIDEKEILRLALSVELFHSAALIHDDIMDNAKLRRGKPTALITLGKDRAILAGDLALIWADEIFWSAKIEPEILLKAKPYFDLLREEVMYGQSLDLIEVRPRTRTHLFKTYEYKTAKYSFERPLHIGAVLAGANSQQLKTISEYAISVGVAFQIQDDILGVFGNKTITGKDVDSDIKEGKQTILMYNLQCTISNSQEKNKLNKILRNKNATREEINWVKNIIKSTGALKQCQETAKSLVEKGKKALLGYNNSEAKEYLLELADYCIKRRN